LCVDGQLSRMHTTVPMQVLLLVSMRRFAALLMLTSTPY
jgi:hypothetical protein